ncbi:hypothetical protein GEV38_18420 [Pseudomonas sp. 13159349]|nr:hypothetical protein GEV38_18420 [Pseudomonas sp. 13159349]
MSSLRKAAPEEKRSAFYGVMANWGREKHDGGMIDDHSPGYLTLWSIIGRFFPGVEPVGAGVPAKNATRYMAPASPVFAGSPAPTRLQLNR